MILHFLKLIAFVFALILLTACATKKITWAPNNEVIKVTYKNNGHTSLTLFTMIDNTTGAGGHSALLINGDERILFDPAGTFVHPQIPERHDVLFGMSEAALERYVDYHARPSIHVVMQEMEINAKMAKDLSKEVQDYGPVKDMMCSYAISEILSKYTKFKNISKTLFPKKTMRNFGSLEGVETTMIYDYYENDKTNIFLENQLPRK